jgi:hypothetical protein
MHIDHPDHPRPDEAHYGPVRNTFRRTHRFAAVLRDQDEIALLGRDDPLLHTLFSSLPDDCGLYNKPMARNAQLWTTDFRLLLDGPAADGDTLRPALRRVEAGGLFGYRFQYPAMRVGRHEVYWHRPLAAYLDPATGHAAVVHDAPLGYLTAYRADAPRPDRPVELWPRLLRRDVPLAALSLLAGSYTPARAACARRIHQVHDAWELGGREPLPRSFARQLMRLPHKESLDEWLAELPGHFADAEAGRVVAAAFECMLAPPPLADVTEGAPESLTYAATATREFELTYWRTIARLATGQFVNKNNGDCVRDPVTQRHLTRHERDLEALGDHLLAYYAKTIADAGMTGKALAGEVPFVWQTDWDFSWMGGWLHNQEGRTHERDLLVVIPGRDRSRAVIMGDHYDTAYMADLYERKGKAKGPRLATPGADDNHSATAALMLAAPVFLELSKAGQLGCDVWLVHLTGEEFPADCLGARNLTQRVVEGTLELRVPGRNKPVDLSGVRVQDVYVLDMVAHNRNSERDVFQIAPGTSRQSLWLAEQAHAANELWNAAVPAWNRRPARRGKRRSVRVKEGTAPPPTAAFRRVSGEVRTVTDPRSTLYNTDGQIFSDAGVPVVLFMENYDINRSGYHDTQDTLANIDLDYGAAVTAIAIESVARAATETPPA